MRSFQANSLDVGNSQLEISDLSLGELETSKESVDSVISPVDVTELVVSLRDGVVGVTLVATIGAIRLLLLVRTTVARLVRVTVTTVGWLGGSLVSVSVTVGRLGGGGLVAVSVTTVGWLGGSLVAVSVTVAVAGALRSLVLAVIEVTTLNVGVQVSAGVVAVLGVGVIGVSLGGSEGLSGAVLVGGVSPWVLGVLTVEVDVGGVLLSAHSDGTVVGVRVTVDGVVILDLLLGVAAPVVVLLSLVVWVALIVVLAGRVELGRVRVVLAADAVVSAHAGVDSLSLLVVVVVALLLPLGGDGGGGEGENESGFHVSFCKSYITLFEFAVFKPGFD